MRIKLNFFSGERPRMADHLLKDFEAQIAQNCDLTRGDIRPMKAHSKDRSLAETGTLRSLYHWKTPAQSYWIAHQNELDFVRSPIAGEAHSRVYFTGMDEPRVLTTSIMSSPFNFLTDFYKLGIPAASAAPTIAAGYTTGSTYRAYVYTYVVKLAGYDAEEGPNSPIASVTDYGSGAVMLSSFEAPPAGRSIGKIRIYRTSSGTSGLAEFRFVAEFDTEGIDFSTFVFPDNIAESALGLDTLVTENWTPPPTALKGLIALVDGALAGFYGNRVYFSEPFLPHAWPYSYPVDAEIVGLGLVGSAVAVLTDEFPYLMTGQPNAMQTQKFQTRYPCLSKPGISSSELGVLYPSDEGIVQITYDGPQLLSYEYFTSKQYNDNYYPRTIRSTYYKGRHLCFHIGGGFAIDLRDKTLSRITDPLPVEALHVSLSDANLYIAATDDDGSGGNALYKFEGGDPDYRQFTYRSKNFILDSISNLTVARLLRDADFITEITAAIAANEAAAAANAAIFASGSGTDGVVDGQELNAEEINFDGLQQVYSLAVNSSLTFNLYADGTLIFTTTVTDDEPFRLPADVLYKRCFFEIVGYVPVEEVALATSVGELDG